MDNPVFTSYHKAFRVKYHFVFVIKYRKDLFLNEKYVQTVKNICNGLEQRYTIKFETIGFDEDHVHFLLQSVPKYSPSQIFRLVKSITARKPFKTHPDLKKELWDGQFGLISMDPYVFRASFLLYGGNLIFEKENAPKGFKFKRDLTKRYYENAIETGFDPIKMIEIRRHGLVNGEAFPKIYAYEEEQSKKLGYLLWLVDNNVRNLRKAGIEYKVVKTTERVIGE